ncbi:sigma54 specific transcriptional regulator, Fis family [Methylocaldum marinum]|uniref:Sigma54 specific transcriptional regulator, Fis family n=1 Tax=Methylocaldum marinum TaxID=1432792 RepID=A0A250L013_9GAMM|nr:sigma54 specific transcriptional regulator, Fis family [Methylocaldum marinum]
MHTARLLGISRNVLRHRLALYGMLPGTRRSRRTEGLETAPENNGCPPQPGSSETC